MATEFTRQLFGVESSYRQEWQGCPLRPGLPREPAYAS